jgi:glucose-6-phosphate 1-epimerase
MPIPIDPSPAAGNSDSPKITLTAPDGARAEIYRHGAHLASWIPAGGEERLFLSSKSSFGPGSSIRGGVPVIFPQFAAEGPLLQHGFARRMDWNFVETRATSAGTTALFRLQAADDTRRIWPHEFTLELSVTVGGPVLEMALSVVNSSAEPFSFTAALHTYLRVADIQDTFVSGLGGQPYLDKVGEPARRVQREAELHFHGEVNRIYYNVTTPLAVHEKARALYVTASSFPDVVVWNPWIEPGATIADLEPDGYCHMLCIEAVAVGQPMTLRPGERWQGAQRLEA